MRKSDVDVETRRGCTPCAVFGRGFHDPAVPNNHVSYISEVQPGSIESAREDDGGADGGLYPELKMPDDDALRAKYSGSGWVDEEGRGRARAVWAEQYGYEYFLHPHANGCHGMFARTDITIRRPLTKREISERVEDWKRRFERVRYLRQFAPAVRRYIRLVETNPDRGPKCLGMKLALHRTPTGPEEATIWQALSDAGVEGWRRYAEWLDWRGEPGLAQKIRRHIASQTRPTRRGPLGVGMTGPS